jgi:hypothetical protein
MEDFSDVGVGDNIRTPLFFLQKGGVRVCTGFIWIRKKFLGRHSVITRCYTNYHKKTLLFLRYDTTLNLRALEEVTFVLLPSINSRVRQFVITCIYGRKLIGTRSGKP